jgi:2-polyprenyl-3-methyl-5-hydroxy-6-metoxy-1,4-benzoquinol methylase
MNADEFKSAREYIENRINLGKNKYTVQGVKYKEKHISELMLIESDELFISILYRLILNREEDYVGLNFHLNNLNSGKIDRIEVLRQFYESEEAVTNHINLSEIKIYLDEKIKFKNLRILFLNLKNKIKKKLNNNINYEKKIKKIETELETLDRRTLDILDFYYKPKWKDLKLKTESHTSPPVDDDLMNGFFAILSEKFRGSEKDIYHRNLIYKPVFENLPEQIKKLPILDIACGRGEMLDVINECGFQAIGVDLNDTLIRYCEEKKLKVFHEDAFKYLAKIDDSSLAGVVSTHFIEHLFFTELVSVITESYRTLSEGGVLILETPNPLNLVVSSIQFYMDPTHKNPLPLPLIKLLMEYIGFTVVEVDLSGRAAFKESESTGNPQLDYMLNAPQDYALLGVK